MTPTLPIQIVLPPSFYQEEWRCNYFVSSQTKEIWAIELDLLAEFIRVCQEHSLHYCLGYGSLLGAIRHHGMIPWDKDIDIFMPRKDYNKLCQLNNTIFTEPYWFQTPETEGHPYFRGFARLRNSATTGMCKIDEDEAANGGIFLDIFVVDEFPTIKAIKEAGITYNHTRQLVSHSYKKPSNSKSWNRKFIWWIKRVLFLIFHYNLKTPQIFTTFNTQMAKYVGKNCPLNADLCMGYLPENVFPKIDWNNLIQIPFETLMCNVPKNYHIILTSMFGNYMQIPDDEHKVCHDYVLFDPHQSYKEYYNKKY